MDNSWKTNRLRIVFLPVFIVVFALGWCLYVVGERSQKYARRVQSKVRSDGVTFLPAVFEDEAEIVALN